MPCVASDAPDRSLSRMAVPNPNPKPPPPPATKSVGQREPRRDTCLQSRPAKPTTSPRGGQPPFPSVFTIPPLPFRGASGAAFCVITWRTEGQSVREGGGKETVTPRQGGPVGHAPWMAWSLRPRRFSSRVGVNLYAPRAFLVASPQHAPFAVDR
ncbi:hypothetical protein NL676_034152 [Syzygium grande]|nr:hypothetical protein NL676_034152 [Syzygium grande]